MHPETSIAEQFMTQLERKEITIEPEPVAACCDADPKEIPVLFSVTHRNYKVTGPMSFEEALSVSWALYSVEKQGDSRPRFSVKLPVEELAAYHDDLTL